MKNVVACGFTQEQVDTRERRFLALTGCARVRAVAVRDARSAGADVVILNCERRQGLVARDFYALEDAGVPVLAYSDVGVNPVLARMLSGGGRCLLAVAPDAAECGACRAALEAGRGYVTRGARRAIDSPVLAKVPGVDSLSRMQFLVLFFMLEGAGPAECADALGTSADSVRHLMRKIRAALFPREAGGREFEEGLLWLAGGCLPG